MDNRLSPIPLKGRGAISNPPGRFEATQRHAVDDGWDGGEDAPPLGTRVTDEACRSILTANDSPDLPFERSINPYRGCEHGCVYCFARPSHAYLGLSPGLDFESRLYAKAHAADVLARELGKPGYRCRPVMLGANTDPYQPIERRRRITRRILKVLAAFNHPVAVTTKSRLVTRDLDILSAMAERGLAMVAVSITTFERQLAGKLEPRAASPEKRLETIRVLSAAGIPTAVMAAPMIPSLNDAELERILEAAARAGAVSASYALLRLPYELKQLITEWLERHAPGKTDHVLNLLRACHGGKLYDGDFASRLRGSGIYADLLAERFRLACKRLRLHDVLAGKLDLDCSQFRPPPVAGQQLALFSLAPGP